MIKGGEISIFQAHILTFPPNISGCETRSNIRTVFSFQNFYPMNLQESQVEKINKLKNFWKVTELVFIGKYIRPNYDYGPAPYGLFVDLQANDRTIYYPPIPGNGRRQQVAIKVDLSPQYIENQYYRLTLCLAPINEQRRMNNPYLLTLTDGGTELISNYDSPEVFINKWFLKKGENPGDASTIASQLKLNELELYTQTERFIFELLQNADDMPVEGKPVNVHLDLLENHFLFLHNGKFFDRDDVMAIADAAKSTKSQDKTKIGYKGIGFKSVFTDSSRVYIKSGDYFFKFDKHNPIYKDFWSLYDGYKNKLNKEAQEEFQNDYQGKEREYTQIDKIPWQIKPIWVNYENVPKELKESNFFKGQNVAIALEIGKSIFQDKNYPGKVRNLLSEPRFLLFLKNIESLSFHHNQEQIDLTVKRRKAFLHVYQNEDALATFIKSDYEVRITNESFLEAGLNFQKREIEKGKFEFIDGEGRKIENIPEKLSILDSTTISFAAKVQDDQIESLKRDDAIIFNYLPTSDKRFEFPFLVNGDFVTKTDREFILHENVWNQYLFYHIGFLHILWAEHLIGLKSFNESYLNVLYQELKDEEDSSFGKINASFNRGFQQAIEERPFILNDQNRKARTENIILDETGISEILGHDFFYLLFGNSKRLPLPVINKKVLKRKVFSIEKITSQKLIEKIKSEEGKLALERKISTLEDNCYEKFLAWLDNFCEKNDSEISNFLNTLRFIRLNSGQTYLHSNWESLVNDQESMVLQSDRWHLKEILHDLGFNITDFCLDEYSNIYTCLSLDNSYLSNDLVLFKLIQGKCSNNSLSVNKKIDLFRFLRGLSQVGDIKCTQELNLFKDVEGSIRPLIQLVENTQVISEPWLQQFKIDEEEGRALKDVGDFVCTSKNLYTNFIYNDITLDQIKLKITSQNLSDFYSSIDKYFGLDISEEKDTLDGKEIIYVNDEARFKHLGELYYSKSLFDFKEKYSSIKSCIESLTGLILPDQRALGFIVSQKISYVSKSISDSIIYEKELAPDVIKDFLNYLIQVDVKEHIFLKGYFELGSFGMKFIMDGNKKQYYTQNNNLEKYIEELPGLGLEPLPQQLSSIPELEQLGVLTSKSLVSHIIENSIFDISFVRIIKEQELNIQAKWLAKAEKLSLSANSDYPLGSNEDMLLKLAIALPETHNEIFEHFRNSISIDGAAIADIAISDRVYVRINEQSYGFSLAEILPHYDGISNLVSKVIDRFSGFGNKDPLVKRVFRLTSKHNNEIIEELKSKYPKLINPAQYVFIALVRNVNFTGFDAQMSCVSILQFCYENFDHSFPPLKSFVNTLGFTPKNCVYPNSLAYTTEELPDWTVSWIEERDSKSRVSFLKEVGLNTSSDLVGVVRNYFTNSSQIEVPEIEILQLKQSNQALLKNTLLWIFNNPTININQSNRIEGVTQLLKNATSDLTIPIPVISSVLPGSFSYSLTIIPSSEAELVDLETTDEEFREMIFSNLGSFSNIFFVDASLPTQWKTFLKVQSIQTSEEFDTVELQKSNPLLSEPYTSWEYKGEFPVFVYQGKIPRVLKYRNLELKRYNEGDFEQVDGKYYINQSKLDSLLIYLKDEVPSEKLNHFLKFGSLSPEKIKSLEEENLQLRARLQELESKSAQRPFEEHLDKESQKRESEIARQIAKEEMEKLGYSFTRGIGMSSVVPGVFKDGVEYPLVVKGHKGTKLNIHPAEWVQLLKDNSIFVVHRGNRKLEYIQFGNLLSNNTHFHIQFDIETFTREAMEGFAHALNYVRNVHFQIDSPHGAYSSMLVNFQSKEGEAGKAPTDFLNS